MKHTIDVKRLPSGARQATARSMFMLPLCVCLFCLLVTGCAKKAQQQPPDNLPTPQVVALPLLDKKQGASGRILASGKKAPQGKQSVLVDAARENLGVKYKYGGTTPETGFDCSGLVCWTYQSIGVSVPRRAQDQYSFGYTVPSKDELQPGDIVLFKGTNSRTGWHSGIYSGNGKFIHSPRTGKTVEETSLANSYYAKRYVGARRVQRSGRAATMFAQYKQRDKAAGRTARALELQRKTQPASVQTMLASADTKTAQVGTEKAVSAQATTAPVVASAPSTSAPSAIAQGAAVQADTALVLAAASKTEPKADSAAKESKASVTAAAPAPRTAPVAVEPARKAEKPATVVASASLPLVQKGAQEAKNAAPAKAAKEAVLMALAEKPVQAAAPSASGKKASASATKEPSAPAKAAKAEASSLLASAGQAQAPVEAASKEPVIVDAADLEYEDEADSAPTKSRVVSFDTRTDKAADNSSIHVAGRM